MCEHWGRAFEVVEIKREVHNMSWPLLRKREVELTAEELDQPGDGPREYAAMSTNTRLLALEAMHVDEAHRRESAALEASIRAGYERSWSWRLTRPLRAIGRALGRSRRRQLTD